MVVPGINVFISDVDDEGSLIIAVSLTSDHTPVPLDGFSP
jgi:hypothetical protein